MARVKVPVPIEKPEVAVAIPEPIVKTTPVLQPAQTLPDEPSQRGPRRFSNQQLLMAGFGLLVAILLIFVVNLTHDRNQLATQLDRQQTNPTATKNNEVKQLTDQIGQTFLLPTGETPTLVAVTDVTKVQSQAFFKNAHNGDKVLLYRKAGEAILYRPSIKKVVNVAAFDLSNSSAATTPTPP